MNRTALGRTPAGAFFVRPLGWSTAFMEPALLESLARAATGDPDSCEIWSDDRSVARADLAFRPSPTDMEGSAL